MSRNCKRCGREKPDAGDCACPKGDDMRSRECEKMVATWEYESICHYLQSVGDVLACKPDTDRATGEVMLRAAKLIRDCEADNRRLRLQTNGVQIIGWCEQIIAFVKSNAHLSSAARARGEGVSQDDFDALRNNVIAMVNEFIAKRVA